MAVNGRYVLVLVLAARQPVLARRRKCPRLERVGADVVIVVNRRHRVTLQTVVVDHQRRVIVRHVVDKDRACDNKGQRSRSRVDCALLRTDTGTAALHQAKD